VLNFKRPLDALSLHFTLNFVNHLPPHIFGCVIYVHLHPHQQTKLESRAMKCVFVGYNTTQKGYKAYHPFTKRLFVSIDVTFHEHEMFFPLKTLYSSPQRGKGGDLEVQNHDRLDQDIRLFDVMPTTTDDGIQDNGDENMKDQIQNNVNENMVEDDSIISPSTPNPLLIQSENNFVEVSPETLTPFHFIVDTQNYVSTDINAMSLLPQILTL